ncbi:SulP family inorganic anion transporter [Brumimicrobium aurantiacum]|uniref:SulP family inorganic anion transporter n=1 Tax=Brumimicrobium aurantiacum TaxID=1737063 RepID=A0A3E1EXG8_9FLAO|nr:SulP family inorganic anion transporter [Brumimicrobium aurantiacum]RFC54250.1 SulP family inorganic anion transporter [Brumimicrobium aurantiacum]
MQVQIPLIKQLKSYNGNTFVKDLIGGLTVGVMLIPQGMAYAYLAEIPPVYGLYASIIPLLVYMLLGTSIYTAIGPAALTSLLAFSGLNHAGITDPDEFINAVFVIALLSGLIQFLMGIFKMGRIVNFISKPVLKGFIFGAALTIFTSQLKSATGINFEGRGSINTLLSLGSNISSISLATLIITVLSIAYLFFMKRFSKKIPNQLIVMLVSLLVMFFFMKDSTEVAILGTIPEGLPSLSIPSFDWPLIKLLMPASITIAFISFVEVYAIGVSLEDKENQGNLNPNQELIATGLSKVVGSFFLSYPTSSSFSRSAVNKQAGTKTNFAAFFTVLLVVLTLIFLTPYFYYLPKAALAAIIIVAIIGLMDFNYYQRLWQIDKRDFLMLAVTTLVTFLVGVQEGIIAGVVLSIMSLVYAVSYPHTAEIALVKGSENTFRNVSRYSEVDVDESVLIYRFDAALSFANVPHFVAQLKKFEARKKNLKMVIVNAESIDSIDTTSLDAIKDLAEEYKSNGIRLTMAGLKGPVRDQFKKADLFHEMGEENFFPTVSEAMRAYQGKETTVNQDINFQTNQKK